MIDRERQRTVNFTGMPLSNVIQDDAVQHSMGTIANRTREHLGTSDTAIIRMRQRLLQAARALARDGTPPPGLDEPEAYAVRGIALTLPKGDRGWVQAGAAAVQAPLHARA